MRKALESQLSPTKTIVTGKVIDHGRFSSIIELKIRDSGKKVAGKVFKIGPSDIQHLMKKVQIIVKEVNTILKFSHDNIVLSEGVTFLPDRILPVLLMEIMMSSLQKYFINNPNLLKKMKLSILQDTVSGLDYLHNLSPPFTHGHLNAENVLLNANLRAKIGGFDIIEMVDPMPQYEEYKPPEAQGETVTPDPSFDIFSFGHLCLVTILQKEIEKLLPLQYTDNEGKQYIRDPVERRQMFIEEAMKTIPEALLSIVKECLHMSPDYRPEAGSVLKKLQETGKLAHYTKE